MRNNGYLFSYKSKYGEVGKKVHLKRDFEWDTSKLKKVTIFYVLREWVKEQFNNLKNKK